MDYMDLNDACPKHARRQLPSTPNRFRSWMLRSGMVCYLFWMPSRDITRSPCTPHMRKKTSFITPHGLYCYNVMPFGLKNVEPTYQRLVTKMFRPLLGSTMEVYIYDMLVKSKQHPDHATHLQQTFDLLRECGMKLNPVKYAFGVTAGRFLGFMVTQMGIEANPTQLKVILQSAAPTSKKGIQQLTGRLAALGRFISRFTDRLKPFFTTLRGAIRAEMNEKCDRAFVEIMQYLTEPPIIVSP